MKIKLKTNLCTAIKTWHTIRFYLGVSLPKKECFPFQEAGNVFTSSAMVKFSSKTDSP
jgi:hypothetical protein